MPSSTKLYLRCTHPLGCTCEMSPRFSLDTVSGPIRAKAVPQRPSKSRSLNCINVPRASSCAVNPGMPWLISMHSAPVYAGMSAMVACADRASPESPYVPALPSELLMELPDPAALSPMLTVQPVAGSANENASARAANAAAMRWGSESVRVSFNGGLSVVA